MKNLKKIGLPVLYVAGLVMCCGLPAYTRKKSKNSKPPVGVDTTKTKSWSPPDSMMKCDILIVSRVDKSPAGMMKPSNEIGYAGDEAGRAVIAFEKIPGDKVVLRSLVFDQFSNDTTQNGMSRTLSGSNYQTILGTFPVKAVHKEAKGTVIDVTDFINGDNSVVSLSIPFPRNNLGGVIPDRSYIDNIHSFPNNIESGLNYNNEICTAYS